MSEFEFASSSFLIVEDDRTAQIVTSKILTKMGVTEISFADNGAEALGQIDASETPADVVLVDLHMPEMNGVEMLRELAGRAFPSRIVLLTAADALTAEVAEAMAAARGLNVVGRLAKPLTMDGLRDVLNGA